MGKIQLAFDVVTNLRTLADSIDALVNASLNTEVNDDPLDFSKPAEEIPKVDFTEVREFCGKLANDGYSKEIRELLDKYNCIKLSELDAKFYERFLREAEVIPYNAT